MSVDRKSASSNPQNPASVQPQRPQFYREQQMHGKSSSGGGEADLKFLLLPLLRSFPMLCIPPFCSALSRASLHSPPPPLLQDKSLFLSKHQVSRSQSCQFNRRFAFQNDAFLNNTRHHFKKQTGAFRETFFVLRSMHAMKSGLGSG